MKNTMTCTCSGPLLLTKNTLRAWLPDKALATALTSRMSPGNNSMPDGRIACALISSRTKAQTFADGSRNRSAEHTAAPEVPAAPKTSTQFRSGCTCIRKQRAGTPGRATFGPTSDSPERSGANGAKNAVTCTCAAIITPSIITKKRTRFISISF